MGTIAFPGGFLERQHRRGLPHLAWGTMPWATALMGLAIVPATLISPATLIPTIRAILITTGILIPMIRAILITTGILIPTIRAILITMGILIPTIRAILITMGILSTPIAPAMALAIPITTTNPGSKLLGRGAIAPLPATPAPP
ncbi:hypothetical protein PROH_09285 [Prochlorothrix hollandica PCC 9006 = CALU 1027]|uniref:Uncharacterized protein n=1 Tax=Prochlorothrix hollandica PCC 9006 = CALU 1027 TaxID=317619 RepID=A0A0M2PV13_PROHO|nr:hypothetical protein PROH_09285 [Prochlorothrix hollandica PCC 9006 = CALU 1027]